MYLLVSIAELAPVLTDLLCHVLRVVGAQLLATSAAESPIGVASSTRGSEWKHCARDSTLSLLTSDLVGVDDVGGRRPLGQVGVLLLVLVQLVVVATLVVLSS